MKNSERTHRVIARGEGSNHSHVIVGDAIVRNENGEILIDITGNASIKHLLESEWIAGNEVSTNEHHDIDLTGLPSQIRQGDVFLEKIADRTYKYIPQLEYDPYSAVIRQVVD